MAFGRNFRIADVLKVEARIGAITPQLGLVDPSGIAAAALKTARGPTVLTGT